MRKRFIDNTMIKNNRNGDVVESVGNYKFVSASSRDLFAIKRGDYMIIVDAALDKRSSDRIPLYIKPFLEERWRYSLHVSHGQTPAITRAVLSARVKDGRILAYQHAECSCLGNPCAYYGILPVKNWDSGTVPIEGLHKRRFLTDTRYWPRRLYAYITVDV